MRTENYHLPSLDFPSGQMGLSRMRPKATQTEGTALGAVGRDQTTRPELKDSGHIECIFAIRADQRT